jgi:hypothetical protein
LFAAVLAIIAALGAGQTPEPAETFDEHARTAVENTSATPIYEALAVEIFRRELDERLADGLRDWGRDGVA